MRSTVLILVICNVAVIYGLELLNSKKLILKVNSIQETWTAGENRFSNAPIPYVQTLLGNKPSSKIPSLTESPLLRFPNLGLPENFDARNQWPNCNTIGHIWSQGVCGSCWAIAAVSTLADRFCIASNGSFNNFLSPQELLSCCDECGDGCDGGDAIHSWYYFQTHGIVTGGDYGSSIGCQPYQIPPCHVNNETTCTYSPSYDTPTCEHSCLNPTYKQHSYWRDHVQTSKTYKVISDPIEIQKEILAYGPVEASFSVYEDFLLYTQGIYVYTTGSLLGSHSVRLIGWGVEKGVPYWIAANSWNNDWGDKGFFKIRRGSNECGIEDNIIVGTPKL